MITAGGKMAKVLLNPSFTTLDHPDPGIAHAVSLAKNSMSFVGRSNLPGDLHRQLGERTAADVLGRSDSFQMSRVDTRCLTAEMIDIESLWNWPNLLFVHRNMGQPVNSLQPKSAIAPTKWVRLEDPTRRLIAEIFFQPHVGSNALMSFEIPDVPANETNVLAGHVANPSVRHRCDRGAPPAAALADPTRVWWSNDRTRPTAPVEPYVLLALTLLLVAVRAFPRLCFLAAATVTKHVATITHSRVRG